MLPSGFWTLIEIKWTFQRLVGTIDVSDSHRDKRNDSNSSSKNSKPKGRNEKNVRKMQEWNVCMVGSAWLCRLCCWVLALKFSFLRSINLQSAINAVRWCHERIVENDDHRFQKIFMFAWRMADEKKRNRAEIEEKKTMRRWIEQ